MSVMNAMDKRVLRTAMIAIFVLAAIYTIMALWMTHYKP